MQNLTEQKRVGESKRRNLETQLERLNRAIQEKNHKIEPKKEQSMDVAGAKEGDQAMQEI